MSEKKNWFSILITKYNELCKDLGVDNGACRSCVPVVKFDPEQEKTKDKLTPSTEEANK